MNAELSVAAVLVFSVSALAQSPSATDTLCLIEGKVLEAVTGDPLVKARVLLAAVKEKSDGYHAVTDAAGKFAIKEITPGQYKMMVMKRGYVDQEYGERESSGTGSLLTLGPGQKMTAIIFRMVATATISGRVLDAEGEPVPHAEVEAMREGGGGVRGYFSRSSEAQTDDRGEYRIFGLSPGTYTVRARSQTENNWYRKYLYRGAEEPDAPLQTAYYPSATEAKDASPLEIEAGRELAGIDIRLLEIRGVTLRGRVILATTGKSSDQMTVMLMPAEARMKFGDHRTATVAPDGSFNFGEVPPGKYRLMAIAVDMSNPTAPLMRQRKLEVGAADIDNLEFVLGGGAQVTGKIVFEGMDAPDLNAVMVMFRGEDSESAMGGGFAKLKKEDGSFNVASLPPGKFFPQLGPLPEGAYLSEVRVGGRDVRKTGLEVALGQTQVSVDLIVRGDGGVVDGQVLDKENLPANGVYVLLSDEEQTGGGWMGREPAQTDQFGRFSIRGVAPGYYRIFALKDVDFEEMLEPQFAKKYEKKGAAVRVDRNGRHTVEARLVDEK